MRVWPFLEVCAQGLEGLELDTREHSDDRLVYDQVGESESAPHRRFYFEAGPMSPTSGFQDRKRVAVATLVVKYAPTPDIDRVIMEDGERVLAFFENAQSLQVDGTCFNVECGDWIPGYDDRFNARVALMDLAIHYSLTGVP